MSSPRSSAMVIRASILDTTVMVPAGASEVRIIERYYATIVQSHTSFAQHATTASMAAILPGRASDLFPAVLRSEYVAITVWSRAIWILRKVWIVFVLLITWNCDVSDRELIDARFVIVAYRNRKSGIQSHNIVDARSCEVVAPLVRSCVLTI